MAGKHGEQSEYALFEHREWNGSAALPARDGGLRGIPLIGQLLLRETEPLTLLF
jgi:hypothetical protein